MASLSVLVIHHGHEGRDFLPPRTEGCPHISLVFREMWDTTDVDRSVCRITRESEGESNGIPHLAKNERDTRISCTRHQATATCAAFIKESRMKFINANKLHRKSGVWATRPS